MRALEKSQKWEGDREVEMKSDGGRRWKWWWWCDLLYYWYKRIECTTVAVTTNEIGKNRHLIHCFASRSNSIRPFFATFIAYVAVLGTTWAQWKFLISFICFACHLVVLLTLHGEDIFIWCVMRSFANTNAHHANTSANMNACELHSVPNTTSIHNELPTG